LRREIIYEQKNLSSNLKQNWLYTQAEGTQKPQLHKAEIVACNPFGQPQMTKIKQQPYITYIVQTVFIGLIYWFHKSILDSKQVDNISNEIFGFVALSFLIISFILTVWTIFKRKRLSIWLGTVIIFSISIWTYRFCSDQIRLMPYQQRFLLKNETGFPLTDVKLISDRIENVNTILPNETQKAIYKFYAENSSIDLACSFNGKRDTVTLISGLTNSIGYLFDVKIKLKEDKIKVEVIE